VPRGRGWRLLATVALAAALWGVASLDVPGARAQEGPALSPRQEAQALQIERQLLCPQCTNKRLDVCELAICQDMKRLIRERVAAGATSDDILLVFSTRYGDRVLAAVPKSGFNLWLWGWVGGSIVAVAGLGTWWLLRGRGTSPRGAPALEAVEGDVDERWLDAQVRAADAER